MMIKNIFGRQANSKKAENLVRFKELDYSQNRKVFVKYCAVESKKSCTFPVSVSTLDR